MLSQTSGPRPAATSSTSTGLSVEDRIHLLAWVESARAGGIDATEDLRLRPWPIPVSAQVIGVFRAGEGMAAWLVVGQNGLWSVVSVAESEVVATLPSLAEALAIIHEPAIEGAPDMRAGIDLSRIE